MEVIRPPITARAIGARNPPPSPIPMAMGSMPKIMASVVITMGRRRTRPASMSAVRRSAPACLRSFALSTSRIAFFVTSPISMITPIMLIMLNVSSVSSSASSTPMSDSGSDSMMANGCVKLSNWLRQDQEDQDHGQQDALEHEAHRLLQLLRLAAQRHRVARGSFISASAAVMAADASEMLLSGPTPAPTLPTRSRSCRSICAGATPSATCATCPSGTVADARPPAWWTWRWGAR